MSEDSTGLSVVLATSAFTMAPSVHFDVSKCSPRWRSYSRRTKHGPRIRNRHTHVLGRNYPDHPAASGMGPLHPCTAVRANVAWLVLPTMFRDGNAHSRWTRFRHLPEGSGTLK